MKDGISDKFGESIPENLPVPPDLNPLNVFDEEVVGKKDCDEAALNLFFESNVVLIEPADAGSAEIPILRACCVKLSISAKVLDVSISCLKAQPFP
jgi:hypothetical protein